MKEVEKLKKIVNEIFSVDIESKSRKRDLVDARKIYAKILREQGYGYEKIAKTINKDHATIIHYLKYIDHILSYDKDLMDKYMACELSFGRIKKYELNDMLNDFIKHIEFFERQNGKSPIVSQIRNTILPLFNE